jgi:hypothetical protein
MLGSMWRASPVMLAAAALAATGCIPLPVALPPAKASLGIGAAVGNPLPNDVGEPLSDSTPVALGRVGVTPQSAWPEQHRRPIEGEAGYAFQIFTDELRQNRNRHGVYAGISVLAGDWWLGHNWRGRLTLRGFAEYFVLQSHPGDGGGGSWAIGFEIAQYTKHEGEGGSGVAFLGLAAGEWSVGAELVGGYHSVGGAEYGTVGFALTGRWPGLLGVGIIPLTGSF